MNDETLARLRFQSGAAVEPTEQDAQAILDWLRAGHALGYSGPFGDWWLYRSDHTPGQAKMLNRESLGAAVCVALRASGQIVAVGRDPWAKIEFYQIVVYVKDVSEAQA